MTARGAKHPGLQFSKGHVVGKAASVDLSVVMALRITATNEHLVPTVASHVGQRYGFVVEQQVRDCPGHPQKLALNSRPGNPLEVES